jgi:hypothetical protein
MTNETPRIAILDCSTGITTERDMNAEELADLELRSADAVKTRAIEEAEKERASAIRASAVAKLAELGLTEEEAKAIAG